MRNDKAQRVIAFLATMIVVVGGLAAMLKGGTSDRITVTAHFPRTVALYPGSSVRVLGVKVGTVTKVTPDGPDVTVTLDLPKDTKVPADATAVIIPPSLVSDRYVELTPVYDSGATMADGAVIDQDHTMTPVELDEILGSLDSLLVALGPEGANKTGSLGHLVDVGAKALGKGGGKDFNDTIVNLAQAVRTLSDNSGDLTGVITNLAAFTHTLAKNDSQIRKLTGDLATATEFLASERSSLGEALKNLSVALGEVATLVRDHRADLTDDIHTLSQVTQIVVKHKDSLIEALDVLPLGAANLAGTVNTNTNPSLLTCQLMQALGLPCVVPPSAAGPAAARQPATPASRAATDRAQAAERVTEALSLHGLWGLS
jgi:phospholipid/cholesterol/gamma-HCH transport system substrate-binding protein